MRVIRDGRIIGSLTRAGVEDLRKATRLDDDLVCALGDRFIRHGGDSGNMARHPSWGENDWRPIGDIEELRDVSRL